ncbi:LysM peptidoglycan-binding domain-containing protein [Alkanindiges sp. WGS2144]|uniref:LysM peptidoglycan-binding domain-containing protein n=1 Tax=Alkanindiges sp. WGS2144 TaxID=3366808 RepID=UPI0037536432
MKTSQKTSSYPARAGKLLALSLALGLAFTLPGISEARSSPNQTPPSLRSDAPNIYIVKKGDTLWDIAGRYLSQPWRWPEIWAANRHVKNPHWIYPGDRLLICIINGRTVIGRDEGDGCLGIERRMNDSGLPVVKLEPQVRIEPLDVAIPVIPLSSIQYWLKHSRVVSPADIQGSPYVVGNRDNRVIAAVGQSVYVRGLDLHTGQQYGVYREGADYIVERNKVKANLGRELTQVAVGTVTAVNGDIATLELTRSLDQEVRKGDRVMLQNEVPLPSMFYPTRPDQVTAGGRVIRVLDSISSAAKNSVIALDRGTQDGTAPGQVFAIYHQGQTTTDPKTGEKIQLPSERIGLAMIFSAFEQVSYAFVLESELPIKVNDEIRSPLGDLEDQL